jgi:hypothetical protein
MYRVREMRAAIQTINAEDERCPRCKEVDALLDRIDPSWRALKASFEGLIDNGTAISLSAHMLQLIDAEG